MLNITVLGKERLYCISPKCDICTTLTQSLRNLNIWSLNDVCSDERKELWSRAVVGDSQSKAEEISEVGESPSNAKEFAHGPLVLGC